MHKGDRLVVVNIRLTGSLEKLVRGYIRRGYATSKAEVLRMGLRKLAESRDFEDISDDRELKRFLLDIKSGRAKHKFKGPVSRAKEILA